MRNADYWRLVAVRILDDKDERAIIGDHFKPFQNGAPSERDAQRVARALNIKLAVEPIKAVGADGRTRLYNARVKRKGGGFVLGADSVLKAAYGALSLELARRDLPPGYVAALPIPTQRKAAA